MVYLVTPPPRASIASRAVNSLVIRSDAIDTLSGHEILCALDALLYGSEYSQ